MLRRHLASQRNRFDADRRRDIRTTDLGDALSRKYPNADREWPCWYVFASVRTVVDERGIRRVTCARTIGVVSVCGARRTGCDGWWDRGRWELGAELGGGMELTGGVVRADGGRTLGVVRGRSPLGAGCVDPCLRRRAGSTSRYAASARTTKFDYHRPCTPNSPATRILALSAFSASTLSCEFLQPCAKTRRVTSEPNQR